MSSIPMASGGPIAELRLIGCNEQADGTNKPASADGSQSINTPQQDCTQQIPVSPRPVPNSAPESAQLKSDQVGLRRPADGEGLQPSRSNGAKTKITTEPGVEYHRVRSVREQQGISLRSMARRLGIDIKTYRRLEDPQTDLHLSELSAIQQALDVPLADLLADRHSLSRPVEERAKLVKVMKTAVALRESSASSRVERMSRMLCEQLIDLMPELEEVSGWPKFGARRGQSALGKALSQPIDMSQIRYPEA